RYPGPPELYPLPLPDALPISRSAAPAPGRRRSFHRPRRSFHRPPSPSCSPPLAVHLVVVLEDCLEHEDPLLGRAAVEAVFLDEPDRKSTRLNSSHVKISYAVF